MPPPYTHFRMIAYEVSTAAHGGPHGLGVVSGWSAGQQLPQAIAQLPVIGPNLPLDARIRLHRFAGVVDLAWNSLQMQPNNGQTLTVFIAPEFYFRPPNIGAGYDHNTYPATVAMQVINALDNMFAHANFQDWLIVCGTVMWNSGEQIGERPRYYNTAVYVHGGRNQGARLIEKKLASSIDGVPQAMAMGADPAGALVMQSWEIRRRHAFDHDGVRFGLEVCLDHLDSDAFRVLKHVLADWPDSARPAVKLHILTAGGMDIKSASVAADPGGYILRNDGLNNAGPRSELRRVIRHTWWKIETNPWNRWGSATMEPAIAPVSATAIPAGPLEVPLPPGGRTPIAQRLVYYPTINIPA